MTEETRRKLSESGKGRIHSEETKNKISNAHKGKKKPKLSDEHKRKLSELNKGKIISEKHKQSISKHNKARIYTRDFLLKNMKGHLKYTVTLEWLNQFDDIKKLQYLNWSISRKRDYEGFTTEIYIAFVEKFYYDEKFNQLYDDWIITDDKWMKPSLDHIIPKSKSGSLIELNNLQFISWLENRGKYNTTQDEWDIIKKNIHEYF